jgi:hypothetical protein
MTHVFHDREEFSIGKRSEAFAIMNGPSLRGVDEVRGVLGVANGELEGGFS